MAAHESKLAHTSSQESVIGNGTEPFQSRLGKPFSASGTRTEISNHAAELTYAALGLELQSKLPNGWVITHSETGTKDEPTFALSHANVGYVGELSIRRADIYLSREGKTNEKIGTFNRLASIATFPKDFGEHIIRDTVSKNLKNVAKRLQDSFPGKSGFVIRSQDPDGTIKMQYNGRGDSPIFFALKPDFARQSWSLTIEDPSLPKELQGPKSSQYITFPGITNLPFALAGLCSQIESYKNVNNKEELLRESSQRELGYWFKTPNLTGQESPVSIPKDYNVKIAAAWQIAAQLSSNEYRFQVSKSNFGEFEFKIITLFKEKSSALATAELVDPSQGFGEYQLGLEPGSQIRYYSEKIKNFELPLGSDLEKGLNDKQKRQTLSITLKEWRDAAFQTAARSFMKDLQYSNDFFRKMYDEKREIEPKKTYEFIAKGNILTFELSENGDATIQNKGSTNGQLEINIFDKNRETITALKNLVMDR